MTKRTLYVSRSRSAETSGVLRRLVPGGVTGLLRRIGRDLAAAGLPPALVGHRWRAHLPAADAARRQGSAIEIHPAAVVAAPLPRTAAHRGELPGEAGWFGFSFRDVPEREAGPTRLLTIPDARVLTARRPDAARGYHPAIVDARGRSLDLREIRYRPFHAAAARREPDLRLDRALWVAERVYDNHAHWLTAHLPRLAQLRAMDALDGLVLPAERNPVIEHSLALLGIDPAACPQLPAGAVLAARELVLLETDRFRPELLRLAREVTVGVGRPRPTRRVFVSRRSARGRKLLGEEALAPMLQGFGFELVEMERLSFPAQIALMTETETLLAPHGAGLANMLFCAPGTCIVEIADPAYPNPNFYAQAAGLGLDYALVRARGVGEGHPLDHDLEVAEADLRRALETLLP